jgi:hypothetical protein
MCWLNSEHSIIPQECCGLVKENRRYPYIDLGYLLVSANKLYKYIRLIVSMVNSMIWRLQVRLGKGPT